MTHQWAASVPLARVLPSNSTRADERIVELEPATKSSFSQRVLALFVAHDRQVDLLQDNLVLTGGSKLVFAPTCGKAVLPVELLLGVGQADCVNVLLQLEWLGGVQKCPVVGKVPVVEIRVNVKRLDSAILVCSWLGLILCVPLTTSNLQLSRLTAELLSTVACGENDPRGDERATTLVKVYCLWFSSCITWLLNHWLL